MFANDSFVYCFSSCKTSPCKDIKFVLCIFLFMLALDLALRLLLSHEEKEVWKVLVGLYIKDCEDYMAVEM